MHILSSFSTHMLHISYITMELKSPKCQPESNKCIDQMSNLPADPAMPSSTLNKDMSHVYIYIYLSVPKSTSLLFSFIMHSVSR